MAYASLQVFILVLWFLPVTTLIVSRTVSCSRPCGEFGIGLASGSLLVIVWRCFEDCFVDLIYAVIVVLLYLNLV